LNVYGSETLDEVLGPLYADFKSQYGITVNYSGGEFDQVERILAEADAQKQVASAIVQGSSSLKSLNDPGVLEPITGLPNAEKIDPRAYLEYGEGKSVPTALPVYMIPTGFYVNSQLLPDAAAPKSWNDLLKAEYKGKIVYHDPRRSGGGYSIFNITMNTPGYENWNKGLAAQDPLLVPGSRDVDATVARGERAIGVPGNPQGVARQKGTPIKWVPPSDGVFYISQGLGLIKNSPAQNAAKVYFNWLLSPEIQAKLAEGLLFLPVIPGVQHPMNVDISTMPVLGKGIATPPQRPEDARQIYP
jgi:ABC-type Fe3+ transport system substrate-binding protein